MSLFGAALVLIIESSMSWIDAEAGFALLLPYLIFGLSVVVEDEELFTFSDKLEVGFLDFCFVKKSDSGTVHFIFFDFLSSTV